MGLDMHLEKRTYVKWYERTPENERYHVTVKRGSQGPVPTSFIDPAKISYIIQEAGYWRKANAIHAWFVANVQDGNDNCGYYYVTKEKMKELLSTCETVLSAPDMVEAGSKWLPSQEGFFFGSTEYDEGYRQDLEDTVKILREALKDEHSDFYYHSSW